MNKQSRSSWFCAEGFEWNWDLREDFMWLRTLLNGGGQREMRFKPRPGGWMITTYEPMWGKAFQQQARAPERPRGQGFCLEFCSVSKTWQRSPGRWCVQCVLPEGVSWADSLLVIGKLLEGQLIVNHEIYALRGVAKLANAKNAACVWKQWKLRSAPEHRGLPPSAWGGGRQHESIMSAALPAVNRSWLLLNSGICFLEKNN